MKKRIVLLLIVVMLLTSVACGKQLPKELTNTRPELSQMKTICELSVMECYYHNVAKFFEKDVSNGFLGLGKKNKHFWIEYDGTAILGIDVSLVDMKVDDTKITVILPEAKVFKCPVNPDSLSKDSFIVDKKSADIGAEDEIKAFAEAQKQFEEIVKGDKVLLANAQQQAKNLLQEYINNIGKLAGKKYNIKWVYVDADGKPTGQVEETQPEEAVAEPA